MGRSPGCGDHIHGHRFVLVQHDGLDRDMRLALLDRVLPELFALPAEAKQRNVSNEVLYGGYIGQLPGLAYESVCIHDVANTGSISDFANLFWPQGNPAFCEIAAQFAKNIIKLNQTVTEMVLEGIGVRDRQALESYRDQLRYPFRMSHYGSSLEDDAAKASLHEHRDYVMTNLIQQHQVEGLEVQLSDGSWFLVPAEPEQDTCIFMTGEPFNVLTNGRVKACLHRVRTPGNRERYSVMIGTIPTKGSSMVRALDELVDQEHPLMYNPCDPYEYCMFRYSEEGLKHKDTLKAFCGVVKDDPVGA